MTYDPENVFAKILRNEIPSDRVYEDDEFLAFRDIEPSAPAHVIIVPRLVDGRAPTGPAAMTDDDAGMAGRMLVTATKVARQLGLEEDGYRLVLNSGRDAGQTVLHLHLHILGGGPLGPVA
ncbi:MAG: histidine triad nucleotide-binding protein [Chloroflexi bacterium]|nr:histidine triad nucleotide-binding protein [Chloroflexota bacterium]